MLTSAHNILSRMPLSAHCLGRFQTPDSLRRKSLDRPQDNGTFVLPIRQSFVRDARLMPGTLRLLALLAGWKGTQVGPLETTQRILGRHLNRSTRQIYRYLKDAMQEGYLTYKKNDQSVRLRKWHSNLAKHGSDLCRHEDEAG